MTKENTRKITDAGIQMVKRTGELEPYQPEKMLKFLTWACEHTPIDPERFLDAIHIPANRNITTEELLGICITTAEGLVHRLETEWLMVAGRIYGLRLMKANARHGYKFFKVAASERYDTHRDLLSGLIPPLFAEHSVIQGDWEYLLRHADPQYDFNLPIASMKFYCEKHGREFMGYREMPSHAMLRQAIDSAKSSNYPPTYDLVHAEQLYIALLAKAYTPATPMSIHAGKPYRSTGSCTLLTVGDSTESIMGTALDLALHSKHGSGNGLDIRAIGGSGRIVAKTEGASAGPVPFLRLYQETLAAFNQSGKRIGAGVATFNWWHKDVMSLLALKGNMGSAEQRVRGLKYSMVINDLLFDACDNEEQVVLFCPHDARKFFGDDRLLYSHGAAFNENYTEAVLAFKEGKLAGTEIYARQIMGEFLKYRYDHGNLYPFFIDTVNRHNALKLNVYASNLCHEVLIPSRRY